MELFSIFLSIPITCVASMLYCLFLAQVVSERERPCRWLRLVSWPVLSLFAVELALLVTIGSVRSRRLLGPGFYVAHLILFIFCTPALANLLVLRRRGVFAEWYTAGALCTLFAFFLVLLQYGVSESLYGINGDDGPYSKVVPRAAYLAGTQ